jgi:hypothetical protein
MGNARKLKLKTQTKGKTATRNLKINQTSECKAEEKTSTN